MDIDISDDLAELREKLEVMAAGREDAAIVTRAALEIARLRGGDDPAFRPTLTASEKEALIVASIELNALTMSESNHAHTLRQLLARFS